MKKSLLMALTLLLLLSAGGAWWWNQREAADAIQYRTSSIERGPLQATVSASGAVNPVTQVTVGTQVSGQIKELYVDFNSEVKAGQLIAQIDPETFEYRLRSAQADLDAARSVVMTAQATAAASRAGVSRAETDLTEAERGHARNVSLVEKGFIAQSEADRTRALVISSKEGVKAAQAQFGVSDAQIKSAQANVAQRDAALAQARIDLGRTRITSPVNGIVIKRAIEKGQTVAASLSSPELFVIAQNLSDMQVDASVDEADVGRIRTGQKASFTVDAFAGQTFEGEVRQVRKAALNVANVVTYVAVIGFSNVGNRLLPGMTANVRVVTDGRDSALKVANSALRVRVAGVEASPEPAATTPGAAPSESVASGAGSGGGGPMAELRNRMVQGLDLKPEQQTNVDAVLADSRPKFMALRDLTPEERPKARERILTDVRARMGDLLTPEQKIKYAALLAQTAGRQVTRGKIYLMVEGKPKAFNVRLGITDGSSTELLVSSNAADAALLKEGATLITGVQLPGGAPIPARAVTGPRPMF